MMILLQPTATSVVAHNIIGWSLRPLYSLHTSFRVPRGYEGLLVAPYGSYQNFFNPFNGHESISLDLCLCGSLQQQQLELLSTLILQALMYGTQHHYRSSLRHLIHSVAAESVSSAKESEVQIDLC